MSGFLSDIIAGANTGELTKLQIQSYTDENQTKDELVFEAYYNPTSFTSTYAIGYEEKAALGNDKFEMKYRDYSPVSFSMDLLLDGTGSSLPSGLKRDEHGGKTGPLKVDDRIEYFLQVVHAMEGTAHRPRYLLLIWGDTLVANAVLTGLVITKELFDPTGKTLRAKLGCTFKEYSQVDKAKARTQLKSPDMTHIRTVQQGDKLPLMCERIYGDAKLYLEVARYNGLTNYRNLTPGQTLYFPPLLASKP